MFKYIIIESKSRIEQYEPMIVSLFSEFIDIKDIDVNDHQIWIYFNHTIDLSLKDIIINLSQDTLVDFRLYESHQYMSKEDLKEQSLFIKEKIAQINFNAYNYLNDRIIMLHFKKFSFDQMMIETIKTFLEHGQNVGLAAKALYVHRNTLTQRLDKFFQSTGFDVRKFMDGFIIYHLLLTK